MSVSAVLHQLKKEKINGIHLMNGFGSKNQKNTRNGLRMQKSLSIRNVIS